MGFAVVLVLAGLVELHGEGVSLLAKLVVHGDLFLVYSSRDGILVEDDIVGATLVVGPAVRQLRWSNDKRVSCKA